MQRAIARKRPPVDWDDVRVFGVLCREQSLARGARSLGLDKSTVSRRIVSLERALGSKLFVRTHEGLRLSREGEAARVYVERMAAELFALESAASVGAEQAAGVVRVATTEAMAVRLVQGGILDLKAIHPGLEIELVSGNRVVDLARGEADLAVRVVPTKEEGLKARVIAKLGISLFASGAYLRARGLPRSVAQVAGHDVLLPSGELEKLPEARLLARVPSVRVVMRSSSMPAIVEAAARGHGICAITRAWGEATEGLEHVVSLASIPPRPVWLVAHPDVLERPAVRLVADAIANGFEALRAPRPADFRARMQ